MNSQLAALVAALPPGILTIETRLGLRRVQFLRKVDICVEFLRSFFAGADLRDRDMLTLPLFRGLTTTVGIQYFIRLLDAAQVRSRDGLIMEATCANAVRVWKWLDESGADMQRVCRALGKSIDEIEQAIVDTQESVTKPDHRAEDGRRAL